MTGRPHSHLDDLRGATRLAVDATRGITALVEEMHRTIAAGPAIAGKPLERPAGAVTRFVYGQIQRLTKVVGAGIDVALARLAPLLAAPRAADAPPWPEREVLVAVLNGVLGDYLVDTGNPLALAMGFRRGGRALPVQPEALRAALPDATGKLLVLVHGSSASDLQWRRSGHDHGERLAADLGFTPVYARYNSGLHVSSNGHELSRRLEELVDAWPVPLDSVTLLGHSMGGLVARSACHDAEAGDRRWRRALRSLVCLGSPHHGALLERGGNLIDAALGVSRYSAPLARLGKIRSAGVTDLRYGNVIDEHWQGRDRFAPGADRRAPVPLPVGVSCYAAAASLSPAPAASGSRVRGDGLVTVDSALGRHARPEHALAFPEAHRFIGYRMGHFDLLDRPEVYATLRSWLG